MSALSWLKSRLFWKIVCVYLLLSIVALWVLVASLTPDAEYTNIGPETAVSAAVVAWLCGTASVAFVAAVFVSPVRTLIRILGTQDDSQERRHLLLTLQDRNDEFGEFARSISAMDSDRSVNLKNVQLREQQMRSSATQLSAVLQAMVEGVIAVGADERIQFANNVACRMLDLDPKNVERRLIFECARSRHIHDSVREALDRRELVSTEFKLPRNDATVTLVVSPITAGGAVLVFDDVTEVRRLESMRRDFVAGVSHELKTPLTVIEACTETLLDGAIEDSTVARRFLEQISQQSARLLQLILGMLQLARLESGAQVFREEPIDLSEIAKNVTDEFRPVAESRKIELTLTGDPDLFVLGDDQAIRTILGNLVDNAIKYTQDGGSVLVQHTTTEIGHVLRVRDTGAGISAKDRGRIFERFYRVEHDRNREKGGTGLGLAIVKHLTQAMHAEISLISQPGQGSTFEVTFPFRDDLSTDED
ncbi:MAG: ATP-binding protein [Planctomycetaceae bacterium]